MSINPSTNGTMSGRITAPSVDYPFGSSKDETGAGAGDGTPYFAARANDIFGAQQALLRAGAITPSGNPDTAIASQYLQAVVQLASGRAHQYDDTGVADAYVLAVRANQQAPGVLFDGLEVSFTPSAPNTGAATVDISASLGETAGTTVLAVKSQGGADLQAGDLSSHTTLVYRSGLGVLVLDKPEASIVSFSKSDRTSRAFELDGVTLKTAQSIGYIVPAGSFTVSAGETVALPTLVNASDYIVYGLTDGTLSAQLWGAAAPAGSTELGGFHAAYSDASIVPASIWDQGYRPQCSPRAMVQSPSDLIWADIYLMDVDYGLNGYSQADATIADGSSPPIVPAIYGGNGVTTYGSLTWFGAWDLVTSAGKRLPSWGEFSAIAFGVVEQQSVGTAPVTTKYQAGHRSAIGMEQATGVMYQWGSDTQGSGTGWSAITDGRGSVYSSSLNAVRLGAFWADGVNAGSRSADWDRSPSYSSNSLGVRAVCNHMLL